MADAVHGLGDTAAEVVRPQGAVNLGHRLQNWRLLGGPGEHLMLPAAVLCMHVVQGT